MMPQQATCNQCGYLLYEGAELKPPDEILQKYEGKCPNCGKKLSLLPINIEVTSVKQTQ